MSSTPLASPWLAIPFPKAAIYFQSQKLHRETRTCPFLNSLALQVKVPFETHTYPSAFLNPLQAPSTGEYPESIHKEVATDKDKKIKAQVEATPCARAHLARRAG